MEGTTFVDAMLPLCNSIRELEEFIEMFGISPEHPDVLRRMTELRRQNTVTDGAQ